MDEREVARIVGQNIRRLREGKHLSREALAARSACHANWLGTLERGEQNTSVLMLVRIAGALGVEPASLLSDLPKDTKANAGGRANGSDARLRNDLELILGRAPPEGKRFVKRVLRAVTALVVPARRAKGAKVKAKGVQRGRSRR